MTGTTQESPLVLVVDDDPDILEAICDILGNEGYRIARARHGLEALERLKEERPAVILLDLIPRVLPPPPRRAAARH